MQSNVILHPDITYKTTADGQQLKMDIYLPQTPVRATVLYAHGGGFKKGNRKDGNAPLLAAKLGKDGVMVASVDYRLKTDIAAFAHEKQPLIKAAMARSLRIGRPINPQFCGPRLYAVVEELSDAVAFLRSANQPFATKTGPMLALGVSAGGIAVLSLAFPPRGWDDLHRPDAVIGLAAAMVQPWRLSQDGLPSLMVHGYKDRIIDPKNARFAARRAAAVLAPLEVVITDTRGHNPQVYLFIDGDDAQGQPWLNRARRMMGISL